MKTDAAGFAVVNAQSGAEIKLAMESLWLAGTVLAVGGRLVVCHTFRSKERQPLEVVYAFGLPRDAALRRFLVRGEGFRARSELKPVEEAVEAYERGIEEGHLSTLARQYRDGVVNLSLGNIRPGETVQVILEILAGVETRDDRIRFRFPFTLAPCYHPQARAVEVEPGVGEIELPEDQFGDVLLPPFLSRADSLHQVGFDLSVALPRAIAEVASPSHALRVQTRANDRCRVLLAPAHDVPNRDLVLDVRTQGSLSGALGGIGRDGNGHFGCVIASDNFGRPSRVSRRVVFVLDRSGSMQGQPITQAKKAIEACLGALSADDRFSLVAFDDRVEAFRKELVVADRANREAAREFLQGIDGRGGTELGRAVGAAVKLLGNDSGDLFVVTDGQVSATEDILQTARLAEVRIHALGIGSASQDRFLALLARETSGISSFVSPRERVDLSAVELFTNVTQPVARDLIVRLAGQNAGRLLPEPSRTVFSGYPLVIFGELTDISGTELVVEWPGDEGRIKQSIRLERGPHAEVVRLLRGARLITELDCRWLENSTAQRESRRIGERLQTLSLEYGLASRKMALVAVVERAGDKTGSIPRTIVVPVGMPQDVAFAGYFRGSRGLINMVSFGAGLKLRSKSFEDADARFGLSEEPMLRSARVAQEALAGSLGIQGPEDILLELAARLEPDGGMPGRDSSERVLLSIVVLLSYLSNGHTLAEGAFRVHVRRLMTFLESADLAPLAPEQRETVGQVLRFARAGKAPDGNWVQVAGELSRGKGSVKIWERIASACAGALPAG